jgi:pilus assembly protein CpaE
VPEKILIADDEMDTISYLRLALASTQSEIIAAVNGTEALSLAMSERPDLIILDLMMPDIDGFEVARRLKSNPLTAHIPILMFTARTRISDKIAGFNAGADIFITKPVRTVELQAHVKSILAQRQIQVQPVALNTPKYIVGVIGVKGGIGVSTLALNLAIALKDQTNENIAAVEMRPGAGIWRLELNLPGTNGTSDLLRMDPAAITPATIFSNLSKTSFGITLLLASSEPEDCELLSNTIQRDAILHQLPHLANFLVLDIGTYVMPGFESLIDECDELVLVAEPQSISIKLAQKTLSYLTSKGFGSEKLVSVVTCNRSRTDMTVPLSQIEKELGQAPLIGFIPAGEQAVMAARNNLPMLAFQPDSMISTQFVQLAKIIAQHFEGKTRTRG